MVLIVELMAEGIETAVWRPRGSVVEPVVRKNSIQLFFAPCNIATGADAPSLFRLMRALASVGIFSHVHRDCFALSRLAEGLLWPGRSPKAFTLLQRLLEPLLLRYGLRR